MSYAELKGNATVNSLNYFQETSPDTRWNNAETLFRVERGLAEYINENTHENNQEKLRGITYELRSAMLEILLPRFPHHCVLENDGEFEPVDIESYFANLVNLLGDRYRFICKILNDETMIDNKLIGIWDSLKNSLDIKQSFAIKRKEEITSAMAMPGNEQFAGYLKYIIAELSDWLKDQREMPSVLDVEEQAYLIFKNDKNIETHITNSPLSIHLLLQYCALKAIDAVREVNKNKKLQEQMELIMIEEAQAFIKSEVKKLLDTMLTSRIKLNANDVRNALPTIEGMYNFYGNPLLKVAHVTFMEIGRKVIDEVFNQRNESLTPHDFFVNEFINEAKNFLFNYVKIHSHVPPIEECDNFVLLSCFQYRSNSNIICLFGSFEAGMDHMRNLMAFAMKKFAENN